MKELQEILFVSQSAINRDFKYAYRKKTGMEEEEDDNPEEE